MDEITALRWLETRADPWILGLGARVERVACTGAALSLPVPDDLRRPDGTIAPGALSALAETAMLLACARHIDGDEPAAPRNLDLQLFRPATGTALSCTATILRAGKRLVFARATLVDLPSERDVAAATATFTLG